MHRSLQQISHRPWALLRGPWVMAQNWHDLLFAHWPVATERMQRLVPRALDVDTFEGQAWIGVVPFTMSGVRLRGTPALPWLSSFPELNVRTYVTAGGKPGVWFFSLDAANALAVSIASAWFHLPYFHAAMRAQCKREGTSYSSARRGVVDAELITKYSAEGASFEAKPGSIEYFLTERYCLYAERADAVLLRSEIHHAPWHLQPARAEFAANTMTKALGVELHGDPLLHFARLQEVVVWPPEAV